MSVPIFLGACQYEAEPTSRRLQRRLGGASAFGRVDFWVVRKEFFKLDRQVRILYDGKHIAHIPVRGFSVAVEPDTGYVWVASYDGVYRLDHDGRPVWSKETPGGSQKWVCVIPR